MNPLHSSKVMALAVACFSLLLLSPALAKGPVAPPNQPTTGLGGTSYSHQKVSKRFYREGRAWYYLFRPASPQPKSAPVVILVPGWGSVPSAYGAWIEHLVRRGNIVIYPIYQRSPLTPPNRFTSNALTSVNAAIVRLKRGSITPQFNKLVAVGHSAGGQIVANLTAMATSQGIPQPQAVFSIQPGRTSAYLPEFSIPTANLSKIPASTLVVTLIGDRDYIVTPQAAKDIFYQARNVPAKNKAFIIQQTDFRAGQILISDHYAPCGYHPDYVGLSLRQLRWGRVGRWLEKRTKTWMGQSFSSRAATDALDYHGCWKILDGLIAAVGQKNKGHYALGGGTKRLFMGRWSDGKPVKPMLVVPKP